MLRRCLVGAVDSRFTCCLAKFLQAPRAAVGPLLKRFTRASTEPDSGLISVVQTQALFLVQCQCSQPTKERAVIHRRSPCDQGFSQTQRPQLRRLRCQLRRRLLSLLCTRANG